MPSAQGAGECSRPAPFSRILVTGADGFVGRHLVPPLQAWAGPEAEVHVTTQFAIGLLGGPPTAPFDLLQPDTIERAVQAIRPDLIVHLAGQASVGLGDVASALTWDLNFGGANAIARAVRQFAPECAVFFASSADVYGRSLIEGVATEETPLQPVSAYARSKAAAEWLLGDVLPAASRLMIVRPSNQIGPGQATNFVVPAFAQQIAELERAGGGEMRVGNLESERDFLDVRDAIGAFLAILARADELPSRTVLNVASGVSVKIADILKRLRAASRADIRVWADPGLSRPNEITRARIGAARLRAVTNWRPAHSLDETLRSVLDDFRSRNARHPLS